MHFKMRKLVIMAVVLAVFAFPAQAEATTSFTDKFGELWQSTKDKAGELYEAGKEKAPEIIDKGKEVAGAAADKAGELYEAGKEKLPELIEGAKEGISDAQDTISDWNASQQDQFWDWVDGQTGGQTSGSTETKQPSDSTANQTPVTPVIPSQTTPKVESPTPENPPVDGMQNPEADYGDGEGDYQPNKAPKVDVAYVMIGALAVVFCATMLWSLAKYSKARKEIERMCNSCKNCEDWLDQREHGRRDDD